MPDRPDRPIQKRGGYQPTAYGPPPTEPPPKPVPDRPALTEEILRTAAMPAKGVIEPFDAGWEAHVVGLDRATVEALALDPGWALLGWDSRDLLARREARDE